MSETSIKAIFLDIGGVFLTNGWGTKSRQEAATQFNLDFDELNERHHIIFDTYESGNMSLDEYLNLLVFYEPRPFPLEAFKAFMFKESRQLPGMIELLTAIKTRYGVKTFAVNNEGRELNEYRIRQFGLNQFIDAFVSSCFVHIRKPDLQLYKTALDIANVTPEEVVYVDDRYVFIQAASRLGIHCIHHQNVESTKDQFEKLGFPV